MADATARSLQYEYKAVSCVYSLQVLIIRTCLQATCLVTLVQKLDYKNPKLPSYFAEIRLNFLSILLTQLWLKSHTAKECCCLKKSRGLSQNI